jgi:hypothetical protein
VITRQQYVNRGAYPDLWPGWTRGEDGRWYSGCRCPGCRDGFTESDFAASWDEMTAGGYTLTDWGWKVERWTNERR